MKKNIIISIVIAVATIYMHGYAHIIFINGTGSAGKTSIAKELEKLMPGVYQKVTLDDIIWQQLIVTAQSQGLLETDVPDAQAKTILEGFERATMDKLWVAAQIDSRLLYKKVREKSLAGINVLVDTVMKTDDEISACMQELAGLDVCYVLVYCPLTHLPLHVEQRNSSGNKGEKRLLRWAIQEFVTMYHSCEQDAQQVVDAISQKQIDHVIDLVRDEFYAIARNEKRSVSWDSITQADEWCRVMSERFAQQCPCDVSGSCHITSVLPYDCVLNTSTCTPEQCAKQIIARISAERYNP